MGTFGLHSTSRPTKTKLKRDKVTTKII